MLVRSLSVLVLAIAITAVVVASTSSQPNSGALLPPGISYNVAGVTANDVMACQEIWNDFTAGDSLHASSPSAQRRQNVFLRAALTLREAETEHARPLVALHDVVRYLTACRSLRLPHR